MRRVRMRRLVTVPAAMLVMAILCRVPVDAQTQTSVTGAGAGVFPSGASLAGVSLQALKLGMGLTVAGGAADGQFQTTLTGVSLLGLDQSIQIEGNASVGSSGPNTAIVSGACTVDLGDGTPPVAGVPFTVAVVTNTDGTGSLTLTIA